MDVTVSVDDSSEDVPAKRPRPYRIKKKAAPSSSTVCDAAVAPATKWNYGVLIAKTTARMNGIVGKCIAVLDERKHSLLRLCACDSSAAPFWEATQVEAFRVGMTLEYEVGMGPATAYPHKTEDVYVAKLRRSQLDHATTFYSHAQLGAALMPLAKAAVADVWGDECLSLDGKRPVVHAGARAPSLAVIQGYVTAFDDDSGLATLQASCGTVLPRVKVNCQSAGVGTLQAPALLLIGLARPKPPSTTCLVLLIGKLPMPLPVAAASQLPAQPHSISPWPASAQVRQQQQQQQQQQLLLQRRQNREAAAAPTAMVTAAKATAVLLVPGAVAVPPLATEVDSSGGKAVADQRRPVGGSSFLLGASEEDAEDEAENQEKEEEGEGKGGKELAKQMGDGTEADPQMAVEVAGLEAEEGEEGAEEDAPVLRGTALVGRRVRVWWLGDGDDVCYDGLVKSFSSRRGHQIAYDDGELRTHNLDDSDEEVWKLC